MASQAIDTDAPKEHAAAVDNQPPCPRTGTTLFRFSMIAIAAAAVWVVTWLAIGQTVGLGTMALSLIIPSACVILFGLVVLRQEQKWVWPVRRMNELLPSIRAGELPIESLNQIDGGLSDVATEVRWLFQELRSQRCKIAELEAEMSQRVANRTDALERTIGSLRQQATRDALTGLFNRRMLDRYLPDEIDKCRAKKLNLALMMIDVDHFKTLNDTLGHAAGDELLRTISQLIRSSIREQDAAFRCGGDEFVVVLPGCDEDNAKTLATRMTSLVSGLAKTLRLPRQPGLSIGIATLDQVRDASAHGLKEQADKRLYETKSLRKALAKAG